MKVLGQQGECYSEACKILSLVPFFLHSFIIFQKTFLYWNIPGLVSASSLTEINSTIYELQESENQCSYCRVSHMFSSIKIFVCWGFFPFKSNSGFDSQ